jgi:uncharacterized membrane-anchored protein YjiN (DUF445 family)
MAEPRPFGTAPSTRGRRILALTGGVLAVLTAAGGALYWLYPAALWARVFFSVAISGLVGFATNWLAIKMLFHPRVRLAGVQGVVPARRKELARSVGETLEEHLISGDRMHKLLLQSGAVDNAIDNVARHLPQIMADPGAQRIAEAEIHKAVQAAIADFARRARESIKEAASSATTALLTGAGAGALFARLGPLASVLAGMLTAGSVKSGLLNPLIDAVVDKLAEEMPRHEALHGVAREFVKKLPDKVGEMLSDAEVRARVRTLIGDLAGQLVKAVDVASLVENELLAREESELEELIDRVAANELCFIQVAGGGIGMIAGLALVWPWLLLPIAGAFVIAVQLARMAEKRQKAAREVRQEKAEAVVES